MPKSNKHFATDSSFEIISQKLNDNGYLVIDCTFARTGTQERYGIEINKEFEPYKKYIEFRPAEEVFKPEVLKAWQNVVITNNHPDEQLTVLNTSGHAVGFVSSPIEIENNTHLKTQITIYDQQTIDEIIAGKSELSGGYLYEIELTPNEEYDYIQRNIVPNHIAIVEAGRCGESCSLAFDKNFEKDIKTMKVQFKKYSPDGEEKVIFEIEIADEEKAKELQTFADKLFNDSKTMAETSKKLQEDSEAKEDEITAKDTKIATLQAQLDVANSKTPAKDCDVVRGLAKDMASTALLVANALDRDIEEVLAKDEQTSKKEVITKYNPSLKLDGKDATYIDVAFDSIMAQLHGADEDYKKALNLQVKGEDKKDEKLTKAKSAFDSKYGGKN